jgi:hypothetical protein
MSAVNDVLVAEQQAEAAVAEFLEMRDAILGRLSPEALRCVAAIFERRMEGRKDKRKVRRPAQDVPPITESSEEYDPT